MASAGKCAGMLCWREHASLPSFHLHPLQLGYSPDLAYALAACQYRAADYVGAASGLAELIQLGVQAHPELGIGTQTEGLEVGDGRLF